MFTYHFLYRVFFALTILLMYLFLKIILGVTRQVGDALLLDSQRPGRIVSIGIAPWGIIENNHELIGHNKDIPYHSISSPRSKLAVLNNRHTYFLLVDNGTSGRYGAEIELRKKLEKYISIQKLHPSILFIILLVFS